MIDETWIRQQQAEALARVHAWALAVHACAIHHGHPHADAMMSDDQLAIEASGNADVVVGVLGDLLGERIGHQRAIKVISEVMRARPGAALIFTLAGALACAIDWDGECALSEQRTASAVAHARGVSADVLKWLRRNETD